MGPSGTNQGLAGLSRVSQGQAGLSRAERLTDQLKAERDQQSDWLIDKGQDGRRDRQTDRQTDRETYDQNEECKLIP